MVESLTFQADRAVMAVTHGSFTIAQVDQVIVVASRSDAGFGLCA